MKKLTWILALLLLVSVPVAVSIAGEPAGDDAADEKAEDAGDELFEHDGDKYRVVVTKTDEDVELSVVPKGIYKVNIEYPWKYKVDGEDKFKKDSFDLTEARAALAMGEATDGELRFSVCSPETCLIEKVKVAMK